MLLSPSKKSKAHLPPQLDTPEQVAISLRRDRALSARADRCLKEQALERGEVDLKKRRALLMFGRIVLVLFVAIFLIGLVSIITRPELAPVFLLTGGGGSLCTLLGTWIRDG